MTRAPEPDRRHCELRIEAATVETLFAESAAAFCGLFRGPVDGRPDRVPILGEAESLNGLLAVLLNDLADLAELEGFRFVRLERLTIDGSRLRAACSGTSGQPTAVGIARVLPADIRVRCREVGCVASIVVSANGSSDRRGATALERFRQRFLPGR